MPSSNVAMNNILNYNFGGTAYSDPLPDPMYFGLSKTLVTATSTGASVSEPSGGSYARKSFTNNTTNWDTSSLGSLRNKVAVTFTQSSGTWSDSVNPILSVFIADTASGAGNIWWYTTLATPLIIPTLTTVEFPIGSILVTQPSLCATTYTLNRILNYNFGGTTYDPDASGSIFFGLSLTEVTAAGLSTVTEPLATSGYLRVEYDNDTDTWTTSSGATPGLENKIAIDFAGSSLSWGIVTSLFIADEITHGAGNILWYKTLIPTIIVQTGTSALSYAAGQIAIAMT